MADPERPLLSDGSSDADDAADAALGGEFLSTLDPLLLIDSLNKTVIPEAVARAYSNLMIEIPALLAGFDGAAIPPKDFRFQDAAFQEDSLYRRWAKAYLAWEREMMSLVDNDEVDWRTRERSRLLMGAVTTAMAPTNFLAGNPAAIKQAMNTGGRSLIRWRGELLQGSPDQRRTAGSGGQERLSRRRRRRGHSRLGDPPHRDVRADPFHRHCRAGGQDTAPAASTTGEQVLLLGPGPGPKFGRICRRPWGGHIHHCLA